MKNAVEFIGASKAYQLPNSKESFEALRPLSLTIENGECFGLLGPNGAGKTTAIGILSGMMEMNQGDIKIFGTSVKDKPNVTKKILGVVQQELVADSFFRLPMMLRIQSLLSGVLPDPYWINYLLEKLFLAEHSHKTTRELSGGMIRRMMIARALVHKPQVLVLDEPTAGIDVHLRHTMWKFIKELNQSGITIILTTHYLEEAEHFCSRIGVLKKGELITLKENSEILKLGEKPKILFIVNQISEALKKAIELKMDEDTQDLFIEHIDQNSPMHKLGSHTLSTYYDAKNIDSMLGAIEKLKAFCLKHDIFVGQVLTKFSNLEDVFLKLTN
ncbi:MAG: ABC transporter ATP-binding protein [Silvanigrellaceae bacterium]|nr:ABC transporter ATP-binding protein [Silvanigrellaceae bacterium]